MLVLNFRNVNDLLETNENTHTLNACWIMLVLQDPGNILSLFLAHTTSTQSRIYEINFLHRFAAHNSIKAKIYATLFRYQLLNKQKENMET